MNLKKLEVFYFTAKYRSCSRAGDKLLITQPAVSMQIRELEKIYHVRLFTRVGRELQLTDSGRSLYSYAEKIFELAAKTEDHLLELGKERKGTLRIGTTRGYGKYLLPSLISTLQKNHQEVKVIIMEGPSSQMAESIIKMENEIALVADTKYAKSLQSLPFKKEEIFLVVSNKHKWFERKEKVNIEELRNESIILREEGSALRDFVLRLFKKNRVHPSIYLEGGSFDFIKEIVKEGKAISFFTLVSVNDEIKMGIFRPLRTSNERMFLDMRAFFLEKESLSPQAKEFLRIVKEEINREKGKPNDLRPLTLP